MIARAHVSGIAPSIRLIMAMVRMHYADMQQGWGKHIIDMLKAAYPNEKIDLDPAQVGHKLENIVKKQVQQDADRAQEVIQDYFEYLLRPTTPASAKDFSANFPDWHKALDAIFTNVRRRAITESMGKSRSKKKVKGIDEAYGVRGEEGGAPEGGEGRMPTDPESSLGMALDDKAAIKSFIELIDDHIDDLRGALSPDSKALFDLIFEDNVGSFGSDIKENMGQASALKEKHPELFAKNAKRWSGFVGDLRKKLLDEIWKYLDSHLTQDEYDVLKETFFGDVDPSAIRRGEKKKEQEKVDYQRGLDTRKLSRLKWKEQNGKLTPKEQTSLQSLTKKLKKEGVDTDAIKAEENPGKGGDEGEQVAQVAARISARRTVPSWSQ